MWKGVELQKIEKFYFDENRKAVMELVEGSQEVIPVDHVIFAVGQKPRGTEVMGLELTHGPYIQTDGKGAASIEGVFAAGDVVTGTRSVIEAIAAGRTCAEQMDLYLGGDGDISEQLVEEEKADSFIGRVEGFGNLERQMPETADGASRIKGFDLVEKPFTCEEAKCEAGRCLQCDLRLQLEKPKLWTEY